MTKFSDNNYTEVYTYDNVGNMLEKTVNGVETTYSYNAGNQLVEEIINGQTIGYTYNANGDLISKSTGEQYSYDIQRNLISIVGNGVDKQYTYNGSGNRLSETTDGEIIFYVNDINRRFEEVLQTYDADDKIINTYTYGLDRIQSAGETNEIYLYDGRGSVVGSVSDNIITSYAYTAYGELMPNSPQPTIFGYNGEQTDFDSSVQYLRARYYDTRINRFFQEDDYRGDFAEPLTMHRYIYVGNEPINRIDPSGYGWLTDKLEKAKGAVEKTVGKVVKKVVTAGKKTITKVVNKVINPIVNTYGKAKTVIETAKAQYKNSLSTTTPGQTSEPWSGSEEDEKSSGGNGNKPSSSSPAQEDKSFICRSGNLLDNIVEFVYDEFNYKIDYGHLQEYDVTPRGVIQIKNLTGDTIIEYSDIELVYQGNEIISQGEGNFNSQQLSIYSDNKSLEATSLKELFSTIEVGYTVNNDLYMSSLYTDDVGLGFNLGIKIKGKAYGITASVDISEKTSIGTFSSEIIGDTTTTNKHLFEVDTKTLIAAIAAVKSGSTNQSTSGQGIPSGELIPAGG